MAERDPVELINEQLSKSEDLPGLSSEHETFKHWHTETKTILEKTFSPRSVHYQSFLALRFREVMVNPFASPEVDRINAQRFKRDLDNAKNILQGAIKELTVDRTLFKKIQTTPKSVEFALKGEYFVSLGVGGTDVVAAVQSAFDGSGLTPLPGLEMPQRGGTLDERIDRIKRAKFGIYDISASGNTDVFLELGIALGLGRKVLIIFRKGSSLPDSIKSLETIEYEDSSTLTDQLKKAMKL